MEKIPSLNDPGVRFGINFMKTEVWFWRGVAKEMGVDVDNPISPKGNINIRKKNPDARLKNECNCALCKGGMRP